MARIVITACGNDKGYFISGTNEKENVMENKKFLYHSKKGKGNLGIDEIISGMKVEVIHDVIRVINEEKNKCFFITDKKNNSYNSCIFLPSKELRDLIKILNDDDYQEHVAIVQNFAICKNN